MIDWIVAVMSIAGVITNILKNKWCFVLWFISNVAWIIIDIQKEMYAQAAVFFVYAVTCIWGFIQWSKEEKE
jgi:nicotinamide riboside transporter PnuC